MPLKLYVFFSVLVIYLIGSNSHLNFLCILCKYHYYTTENMLDKSCNTRNSIENIHLFISIALIVIFRKYLNKYFPVFLPLIVNYRRKRPQKIRIKKLKQAKHTLMPKAKQKSNHPRKYQSQKILVKLMEVCFNI